MNKVINVEALDGLVAAPPAFNLELESNKRILPQSSRNFRRFIADFPILTGWTGCKFQQRCSDRESLRWVVRILDYRGFFGNRWGLPAKQTVFFMRRTQRASWSPDQPACRNGCQANKADDNPGTETPARTGRAGQPEAHYER